MELARSSDEKRKIHDRDLERLATLFHHRKNVTGAEKAEISKQITAIKQDMERSVAVYGMIGVRTDGKRAIIAQKKEKKAPVLLSLSYTRRTEN